MKRRKTTINQQGGGVVRLGDLKHRIAIRNETQTDDGMGGYTTTPTITATVWGKMEPLTGARAIQYGQEVHTNPYIITILYRGDITIDESIHLVIKGKIYKVKSVINVDEDNRLIEILAVKKS